MKKLLLLILVISSCQAISYQILVDEKFSPYVSSEDFITLHRALQERETKIFHWKKWYLGIFRLLEIGFLWNPFNETITTTNHEIFGHGYRIRDIGSHFISVKKYKIYSPYLDGGGYTAFETTPAMTSHLLLAVIISGVEANSILANRLKTNLLEKGKIDGRQATLYLFSQHDLTDYVFSLSNDKLSFDDDEGHDISEYIKWINRTYPQDYLSRSKLKRQTFINFVDPFTYYSLYSLAKYIFTGKKSHIWMIPIFKMKYLPNFKIGLTPFGPEYFLENYLVRENIPIYAYLKYGEHAKNHYFGLGIEYPKVIYFKRNILGFRIDLWLQPKDLFSTKTKDPIDDIPIAYPLHKKRGGISLSLINNYKLGNFPLLLYGQIGYKTKGFLPGESLKNKPILRVGLSGQW